ncbi:MAG: type III-B CRISPR module RAMP protein Cmr1 [Deltaproteobacteria bacterium]|nr:type III-B CRISPR module RAMP protein Cmr1 [Deltaproteobacteria bacterium]
MDGLAVEFRTLTPLWTGDAQRRSDQVREAGLLGSLRWWYEGIVRGMGGYTCDPSQGGCDFDGNAYEKAIAAGYGEAEAAVRAGLCPVCRFFGATGLKRRFRLEISEMDSHPLFFKASPQVYQAAGNWLWRMFGGEDTGGTKTGRGPDTRFTFGSSVLWGERALTRITPVDSEHDDILKRFAFLLDTATRFGGLGAKTQNGFGQIRILNGVLPEFIAAGKDLVRRDLEKTEASIRENPRKAPPQREDLFTLRSFFSRTYRLTTAETYVQGLRPIGVPWEHHLRHYVPCAFDIRYKSQQRNPFSGLGRDVGLRPFFRKRWGDEVTNLLFGGLGGYRGAERIASRIRVSHLFKVPGDDHWHLKVWGDVPPRLWEQVDRHPKLEEVVQTVDEFIRGEKGMFPGSQSIEEYEFKPEEFLG